MELKGLWHPLGVLVTVWLTLVPSAMVQADTADDVAETAVHLLYQSTVVDRQGTHNLLLKAIRHLKDPATRPLFEYLSHSDHPALKIHGLFGMAELSPDQQIDLSLIAQIDDPAAQSTAITAAMDDDLLKPEQAAQLLAWDGLADEVKVLVAVRLVEAGLFKDTDLLHHAMEHAQKLGGSALAALLLVQLDDPAGLAYLTQVLDPSSDPQRDAVRAMLMQTALRHGFEKPASWALTIAKTPENDPALVLLALRTAMRFNEPGAVELWQSLYEQAKDAPADRMRLALTALHLSPWLGPQVFATLAQSDDPLIRTIGQAGGQIVAGSAEVGDTVAALLEFGHPMVNTWALGYAREHASKLDSQLILLGLILAYEHSPQRGKARRLDEAIEAAQTLYEQSPDVAVKLLRPILTDPDSDALLVQAILLGLVRAQAHDSAQMVEGIVDQLNSPDARGLALLLLARSDRPMDNKQLESLALLARGGGRLEDSLRVQAAWTYLKRTGRAEQALQQVLGQLTHE